MNKYFICAFILFFSGSLFSSVIDANELKTLISGKTVESKTYKGYSSITYFATDGTFIQSQKNKLIKGVWHISESGQMSTFCSILYS